MYLVFFIPFASSIKSASFQVEFTPLDGLPAIAVIEPDGTTVQSVEIPALAMPHAPPPPEGAEEFTLPHLALTPAAFHPDRPLAASLTFCNPLDVPSCTTPEES